MNTSSRITIDDLAANELFCKLIEEMDLGNRVQNALKKADVLYVAELIQLNRDDLLKMSPGRHVLEEVSSVLSYHGLRLGTEIVPTPPPKHIFREMLSGTRPFDRTQAALTLSPGDEPGNETDTALREEIAYLFKDTGAELAYGKAFPERVKQRLAAALKLARSFDEYSKA